MENTSDEQLVTHYLKGDEGSFEVLIKRYWSQIYGFARQYAGDHDRASDIAQETFVKAWRNPIRQEKEFPGLDLYHSEEYGA